MFPFFALVFSLQQEENLLLVQQFFSSLVLYPPVIVPRAISVWPHRFVFSDF